MSDQEDEIALNFQDVTTADDESTPVQGAVGGEPVQDPAVAAPSLNLARFRSSTRGGGEGGGLDQQLEDARREAERYRERRTRKNAITRKKRRAESMRKRKRD